VGAHRAALARLTAGLIVIAGASLAWLHPWTRPPHPPTEVRSIQVLSARTAFVLADPNTVYETTDGGAGWRRFAVQPESEVNFIDARHGFQATETRLLATADGGRSWQLRRLPDGQRFAPGAWFLDADHGWYLNLDFLPGTGLPRHLYRTLDGGRTWELLWSGTSGTAQVPVFSDLEHGWMVADLSVLATADGGRTWTRLGAPRLSSRAGVRLAHGALVEYSSHLSESGDVLWDAAVSADGGATWVGPVRSPGYGILDLAFADARHWRAISRVEVWRTDDAGGSWQPLTARLPAGAWLDSIRYPDASVGWALAGTTAVPFPTGILRTTDGGASWTPISGPWQSS